MACSCPISINTKHGPILVRCKQCLNCRIHKQSGLTARCLLENSHSSNGLFLTLTYRTAPDVGDYKDFSRFLKRLRRHEEYRGNNTPIRFLAVGEYGHRTGRFHFHTLLWNTFHCHEGSLTELWPQGFLHIGQVTPKSIRYTARYTLKFDQKGKQAHDGWSTKPPLGSAGIRCLARRYRMDLRRKVPGPPTTIMLQGKSYPLDRIMQREFMREYLLDPAYTLPTNPVAAHTAYLITKKLGDPIAAQRLHQENRNTFYETARFSHGKL